MATPAASAFHRRRILTEQTPRFTFSKTKQEPQPIHPSQPLPPSSLYHQHQRHSPANPPPTASPPPPPPPPPPPIILTSLRRLKQTLVTPFLSIAHSTVVHVSLVVVITILLLHVLRFFLMSSLAPIFLSCPTQPPPLSILIQFTSILLLAILIVTQLASHFLLSRALDSNPPAKAPFFAFSFFTIPVQALLSAYVLYGPSLAPHHFFCATPTSVFPSRNAFHTPVLSALTYVPFLYIAVFHLRIHSLAPSPFPQSSITRILSIIPHALLTTLIPAIPTVFMAVTIATATRPPRSFYSSLVLTGSRTAAAICSCIAAALPHTLLRFSEGLRGANCTAVDTNIEENSVLAHDTLSTTSASIITNNTNSNSFSLNTHASASAIRHALVTLCRAPKSHMLPFPPFGDPSGRQWRITLDAALAPLKAVVSGLRDVKNPSNSMATIHANSFAVNAMLPVSDAAIQEAIAIARVLPTIFEASVEYDSFGVVLPSLPYTLGLLAMLHDGLSTVIVSREALSESGRKNQTNALFSSTSTRNQQSNMLLLLPHFFQSIVRQIEHLKDKRSQASGIHALKDIVAVCVYRLSYTFQEEISRFVNGHEPGWDVHATEALRPFLRFEI